MPNSYSELKESEDFKSLSADDKYEVGGEFFFKIVRDNREYFESDQGRAEFENIKKDFFYELAEDTLPSDFSFEGIGNRIGESFARGGRNLNVERIIEAQENVDDVNRSIEEWRGFLGEGFEQASLDEIEKELQGRITIEETASGPDAFGDEEYHEFKSDRSFLEQNEKRIAAETQDMLASLEESSKRTPSKAMVQFEIAGGFKEFMRLASDSEDSTKGGALAALMAGASAESFNESLQGLLAGVGGTILSGGNVFAGAGAAATMEYRNEFLNTYQAELLEAVEKLGGPTEENVKKVLEDKEFHERVDKKATKRGATIGTVGGLSQLVSGGIAKKLFGGGLKTGQSTVRQAFKSASIESILNIPAEGLGEAAALAATEEDGKFTELVTGNAPAELQNQVTLEMAGAGGQGPVQTIGVGVATALGNQSVEESLADQESQPVVDDPIVEQQDDVQNLQELRERNAALAEINSSNPSQVTLNEQSEVVERIRAAERNPEVKKTEVRARQRAEEIESARLFVVGQMQRETENLSKLSNRIGVIDRVLDFGVDEKSESALIAEKHELQKKIAGEPEESNVGINEMGPAFAAALDQAVSERNQINGKIEQVSSGLAPEILNSSNPLKTAAEVTEALRSDLKQNQNTMDLLAGKRFATNEPITTKSGSPQKGFKSEIEAAGFRNRQPNANQRGLRVVERDDGRFVVVEPTFQDEGEVIAAQRTLEDISGPAPNPVLESQDASLEAVREEIADPLEEAAYSQNHAGIPDRRLIDRIVARQKPEELDDGRSELRAKNGFRELFSRLIYDQDSRVPDWFREIADVFASDKKGAKLMANNAVAAMEGEIRKATKGMSEASEKSFRDAALDILQGRTPSRSLPSDVVNSVAFVRNMIDEFTGMAIQSGALHPATQRAYEANLGEYTLRAYKIQDPSYNWSIGTIKRDNPGLYQRGVDYFKSKGLTQSEAEATVASIANPGRAQSFLEFGRSFNNLPPSYFKSRKEIAPIIRELMGEITNPFDVAARSLDKVSTIAFETTMQRSLIERGVALGVLSSERTPVNSERLNFRDAMQDVIGDVYSDPITAETLVSAMSRARADQGVIRDVLGFIAGATAVSKFMTVIASAFGVQTNALGAIATEMWNGRSPMRFGKGLKTHFVGKVKRITRSPEARQETMAQRDAYLSQRAGDWDASKINTDQLEVELETAGIFNQNVFAQDFLHGLDRSVEKGSKIKQLLSKTGLAGQAVDGTIRAMADVYQSPDNAVKANAFLAEAETYAKANPDMTVGQIFELAGADVLRDTQNYAKVPSVLRAVSTYGGLVAPVSPYISFSSELIRSFFANYAIAGSQIKSGNPVLVRRGLRRIAGGIALTSAAVATKAFMGRKSGLGEDEQEFFREFYLPEFHNKKSITFVPTEEGRIKYLDDTYALPQIVFTAPFERAAKAAMDGDQSTGAAEAFLESFGENVVGQFEGDSQVREALQGLANNKDKNGRDIFNPDLRGQPGAGIAEAQARMNFAIDAAYLPSLERFRQRVTSEESIGYFGNVSNKELELQKMLGIRPYEIDLKTATPTIQKRFHTRYRNLKALKPEQLEKMGITEESRDASLDVIRSKYQRFREKAIRFGVGTEKTLRETEKRFNKEFRGW